jgi:lipopolysaccharide transport system permease protein
VWNFRGFVLGSVRREFQLRYRGAVLGLAWAAIQPLAMIFIYTVIFSQVMNAKLPGAEGAFSYGIYLCAGIVTWGLFAETVQRGQSIFLDNANLLKKLSFPRLTLPVIVAGFTLANFSIAFGLFLIFLLLTGNFPGLVVLAVIPLLVVQMLLALGLGIALGVFNVFLRDTGQISGLVLQFWFWATPIVYPVSILPDWMRSWMSLNPMFHLVIAYQQIFVAREWPEWNGVALVGCLAVGIALYALGLFRRKVGEIVDQL